MASLWKKRARRLRVCVSRRIRGQNNFRNNFISVHGVLTGDEESVEILNEGNEGNQGNARRKDFGSLEGSVKPIDGESL